MTAGLVLALIAGLVARAAFRRGRPSILVALIAGVAGTVIGSPVAHWISGEHDFHAFRPESFIAAIAGALVLLAIYRRARLGGRPDERRIFS